MQSRRTKTFDRAYDRLERKDRRDAIAAYRKWNADPYHPGLNFKKIHADVWQARISIYIRAFCVMRGDCCYWFWIGTHQESDEMTSKPSILNLFSRKITDA